MREGAKVSYRADGLEMTGPGRSSALILRGVVALRVGAIIAAVSTCADLDPVLCRALERVALEGLSLRIGNRNTLVRRRIALDLDVVGASILALRTVAKEDAGGTLSLVSAKGKQQDKEHACQERHGKEESGQHSMEVVSVRLF